MPEYRRALHRLVGRALNSMDARFLARTECYFGGGTMLAMTLKEYRESRDIDFLCSSRVGFRSLRETITDQSLGAIFRQPMDLARDVRADRDGIRTFLKFGDVLIKFEIILEARIDLEGAIDETLGVPTLRMECAVAEKFLANTDRGLDESTLSRDIVDLSFAAAHSGRAPIEEGMGIAEQAYGTAVRKSLRATLDSFKGNRSRASAHIRSLGVEDTQTLRKGMRLLGNLTPAL
ncbi:MAG TPA: nucleotidyl transferase AbiEii/AbiGii toxin family protein [Woeseiaceae bacterium]|nr:nucleotidyl transferase AbiEii/AbiGii toxin family protein [Woeseiaceae bacterium]